MKERKVMLLCLPARNFAIPLSSHLSIIMDSNIYLTNVWMLLILQLVAEEVISLMVGQGFEMTASGAVGTTVVAGVLVEMIEVGVSFLVGEGVQVVKLKVISKEEGGVGVQVE